MDALFLPPSNLDIPLWRYVDLAKFVAMLQTRALVFAPAVILDDRFEGSFPLADSAAERVHRVFAHDERKPTPEQTAILERDLTMVSRRLRVGVSVSCWYAGEEESLAMWKLYAHDAVCVQSTYRDLCAELRAPTEPTDDCPEGEYRVGQVRYINYFKHSIDSLHYLAAFMHKRGAFAHEREVRAIFAEHTPPERPTPKVVPVDLCKLVHAVLVAPGVPSWFMDTVRRLLHDYALSVPLRRSELDAEPTY